MFESTGAAGPGDPGAEGAASGAGTPDALGTPGAAAVQSGPRSWSVEPGSGWSPEQIEALIWAGVPVVTVEADGLGTDAGGAENAGAEAVAADGSDVEAVAADGNDVADTVTESPTATATADSAPGDLDVGEAAALSWLDEIEAPQMGPVSWLSERTPSGALLADLERLPAEVVETDYDAVELVALWAGLEAYCAAGKRLAAAALARREAMAAGLAGVEGLGFTVSDPNIAGDELSLRLGISRRAAQRLIRSGRVMNGAGIPAGDALISGDIDSSRADLILEAIADLPAEAALEVQERVLPKASHLGPGRLRRELAAAVAAVDPEDFEERCAQAAQSRRVDRPRALPHGMASLYAVLPAAEATQIYRTLDAAARSAKTCGDETRTMDQLRADALALLATSALETGWIGAPPTGPDHRGDSSERGGGIDRGPDCISDGGSSGSGSVHDDCDGTANDDGDLRLGAAGAPERARESCPRMRIGRIGGMSAHVKVVVPHTLLMDSPHVTDPPAIQAPRSSAGPARGSDPPNEQVRNDPAPRPSGDRPADTAGTGPPTPADIASANPPTPAEGAGPCMPTPAEGVDPSPPTPAEGADPSPPTPAGEAAAGDVATTDTSGLPARQVPSPDLLSVAELEGYGPIPASVARALAAGSTWARLVVDPLDRTVLECSRETYEPPQAMADLVRAAQPYCAQPSCSVSSDGADLHHRIPWPAGATSVWNLDPGCRRDHLLVTHGGWSYDENPGGTRTWTTATGHTYVQTIDDTLTMHPKGASPRDDEPPPF